MNVPGLPGLPTISALVLACLLASWLSLWGPVSPSVFREYQTLISAAVACVGIAVAARVAIRNVTKQLRVNVVSREEERIEKTLPGLREAVGCIQDIRKEFRSGSPPVWLKRFEALAAYDPSKDRLADKLKVMMPLADAETCQQVLLLVETLLEHTVRADADYSRHLQIINSPQYRIEVETGMIGQARRQAEAADIGNNLKLLVVLKALKELQHFEERLIRRVISYEKRLPKFRHEIERYFDA